MFVLSDSIRQIESNVISWRTSEKWWVVFFSETPGRMHSFSLLVVGAPTTFSSVVKFIIASLK